VRLVSGDRITRLRQARRAGGDPAIQNVFLVGGQRRTFRHLISFHELPQPAFIWLPRNNHGAAFSAASDTRWSAEIQLGFLPERPMALHAVISEQWSDVAIKIRTLFPGRVHRPDEESKH
jgi:hypothetical protein